MKSFQKKARITLWSNRIVFCILLAMTIFLPKMLEWYTQYRNVKASALPVISACMYGCALFAAIALWNMDCFLRALVSKELFTRSNVTRLRNIQWCCGSIAVISIPAAVTYLPLIFLVIIMAFMFIILRVVCSMMEAAVELREENDLTI